MSSITRAGASTSLIQLHVSDPGSWLKLLHDHRDATPRTLRLHLSTVASTAGNLSPQEHLQRHLLLYVLVHFCVFTVIFTIPELLLQRLRLLSQISSPSTPWGFPRPPCQGSSRRTAAPSVTISGDTPRLHTMRTLTHRYSSKHTISSSSTRPSRGQSLRCVLWGEREHTC